MKRRRTKSSYLYYRTAVVASYVVVIDVLPYLVAFEVHPCLGRKTN